MTTPDPSLWLPAIGARFRRMGRDPLTGVATSYAVYEVIAHKPPAFISPHGRIELRGEDGRSFYADAERLWGSAWEAIDNVVPIR